MQSKTVDKDGQSERFSIVKYHGIDTKPQVSGEDTHEEYEGNTKGNAHHFELS